MGDSVFGPYQLIELLGQGGMGDVWRAYHSETRRVVALKVLPEHLARDHTFRQRFQREAHMAASLNDPHVVPIHAFGEINGRLYVDMRLIDGRDLKTLLAEGPLAPARAIKIIEQVASALQAAHEIGLVHRDVKPSNALVTRHDFVYLIDFGIALGAGDTSLTEAGAPIGTWAYMAPERFEAGSADTRSDVYALACVLYELLTGSPPFRGENLAQLYVQHLQSPPPRPSLVRRSVSGQFDSIIARGMAKDPNQRFRTPMDLARSAASAITQPAPPPGPPPAPPVPTPLPLPPQPLRRRAWPKIVAAVAAVAVVAVVAVFAVVHFGGSGTEPTPPVAKAANATVDIDDIALTAADLELTTGYANLAETRKGSKPLDEVAVSPASCHPVWYSAGEHEYSGSDFSAFRYRQFGDGAALFVIEVTSQFASSDDATAFVEKIGSMWDRCTTTTLTVTPNNGTPAADWTILDVSTGEGLKTSYAVAANPALVCEHVIHAAVNFVVEVNVCGTTSPNGEAVASQMIDRITG